MSSAIVTVTDANGDHLVTIGPVTLEQASAYSRARYSKRGEWDLHIHRITDPEALNWAENETIYEALAKVRR